jgi:hypothetical protein
MAFCDRPHLRVPTHVASTDGLHFVIRGIHFEAGCNIDDDGNQNLGRVDIFSQFQTGELHLNPMYSTLADCESSTSNCESSSKSLTFLASPMDVTAILSNLTFVPFVEQHDDDDDSIVIRVYSGQGGNCWSPGADEPDTSDEERSQLTISGNHCVRTQGVIQLVPAPGTLVMDDFLPSSKWYQNSLFDCVVILLLSCLLMCCCGIRYWWIESQPVLCTREYMPEARDHLVAIAA